MEACAALTGRSMRLLVFIFLLISSSAAMAVDFPEGRCAVVVASRPTLAEAHDYRLAHQDQHISEIFLSENGWYAMVVDYIAADDADFILAQRKARNLIPSDSYCSTGNRYVTRIWSETDLRLPSPSAPPGDLFAEFDARSLNLYEKRLLQGALALSLDYDGRLDGQWGKGSQAALEQWAAREFGMLPLNLHASVLAAWAAAQIEEDGWITYYDAGMRFSLEIPYNKARIVDGNLQGLELIANDGSFSALVRPMTRDAARRVHADMVTSLAQFFSEPPYLVRKDTFWVTAFADGARLVYQRSDFDGGSARTAFFRADEEAGQAPANLMIASYRSGSQTDLSLPEDGRLADYLLAALAQMEDENNSGETLSAEPEEKQPAARAASGSGFYINADGNIMTNAHVVEGCGALKVAGRPQSVIAIDTKLDLAVLGSDDGLPKMADVLAFATAPARLNSDVTVAGFPLNGLLSTLNVTRGSVSALKGMDDNVTELQITAPVQAGNSGGPIVDRYGQVVGVVVSKMDGLYVADKTGDLPQNVNFGVRGGIARIFAEANGIGFSQTALDQPLAPEDLADKLLKATVLVECY